VLEIASGSGQHVAHFAAHLQGTYWQPTDRTAADFATISARSAAAPNSIAAPAVLDVMNADWSLSCDFDAVVCINMIHISPWETTPALFAGAARHLLPDHGIVVLYGPYREGGRHTAPSNEAFDQWLKAKDSRFGVRNLEEVDAIAAAAGFDRFHLARLPANNLLLGFRRRIRACNPS
jgi:SAM-dependent methyltransferase